MSEPMTDERLAEIESYFIRYAADKPDLMARELIAETRRLREQLDTSFSLVVLLNDRVKYLEDEGRILWGTRFGTHDPRIGEGLT